MAYFLIENAPADRGGFVRYQRLDECFYFRTKYHHNIHITTLLS
jgi:hypothetical protein